MRERAALFGGHLAAGPDGTGFRVRASLPAAAACDAPACDPPVPAPPASAAPARGGAR
jgi:hypothetical protein